MQYILKTAGTGRTPVAGDTVLVHYNAKTLSDRVFETTDANVAKTEKVVYTSPHYGPVKVPIKPETPVSGFMEALTLFPKGAKATLILHSKLAYGADNYKMLEPYTPMVCDLEIVDIISPKK